MAVGDEVEALLARAVAVDAMERPGDAGQLWGMLKHALGVDGELAQGPRIQEKRSSIAPPYGGSTLRLPGRPSSGPPAIASSSAATTVPIPARVRPRTTQRMASSAPPFARRIDDSAPPAPHGFADSAPPSVQRFADSASGSFSVVPPPPRSRRPVAWLIVLALLVLGALAAGAWRFVVHGHHAALAVAPSSGG